MDHPEWIAVRRDGTYHTTEHYEPNAIYSSPKKHCAWHMLCLNDGEYAEHIYAITEEVCKRYKNVDGLFYDICIVGDSCYCESCIKGMREVGLNPEKTEYHDYQTHFEMEDLPTAWGGYEKILYKYGVCMSFKARCGRDY